MLALLILLFPLCGYASASLNSTWQSAPLKMDICRHNTLLNRHYIVYICNFTNLHSAVEATRDLVPFACDPTNGIDTRLRKRLLFLGQERKADDGFVYECVKDSKTGAVTYRAKSCYVDNERFLPGHFIQGASNTIWLCYRGLDNVIRLRVRHPVHSACNPVNDDPRCLQGITQTIISSSYGYGESFAYNPSTGESLTVAIPPPENIRIISLADDATSVSPTDLLLAVQGVLDPRIKRPVRTQPSIPVRGVWGGLTTTSPPASSSSLPPAPLEEFKKKAK